MHAHLVRAHDPAVDTSDSEKPNGHDGRIDRALHDLVDAACPDTADPRRRQLLEEMLGACIDLVADGNHVADLKLVAASVAEIRDGLACFRARRGHRRITAFGSARTAPEDPVWDLARRFCRRMADAGFMVITGAGPGIMAAANEGAGREASFGVAIQLPFEQATNPTLNGDPKLASFKYFFTRKLFFLKEASALVVFPGGFGTHDEAFECLTLVQTGKAQMMPVVFLDVEGGSYWRDWSAYVRKHLLGAGLISPEDLSLFRVTDSLGEAVHEITDFYRVYHSSRFLRGRLLLRLNHEVADIVVRELSVEFRDLVGDAGLEATEAWREEADEPWLADLPRLAFRFDRQSYGRLRQLIDRLNELGARPDVEGARLPGVVPAEGVGV